MRTAEDPGKRLIRVTLAVVLSAAALSLVFAGVGPAKVKKGTYTGTTSQGQGIQLEVTKKQATVVFIDFQDPCRPPEGQPSYAGISGELKKKGRKKKKFKAKSPADGYYGYVKGTLKGKKAEGTAVYAPPSDPIECGVSVRWTAEHVSD
jgi:hypothetical protein